MKFKVTKKEKELCDRLTHLVKEIESVGGTILTMFAMGKDFGGTCFCGEAERLSTGLYNILKDGMSKNGDEYNTRLACAILEAISILAHQKSKESETFTAVLADIYEHAANSEENDDDVFEFVLDEYDSDDDAREETVEELAAKLDKMGYYVSKKHEKKQKKNEERGNGK